MEKLHSQMASFMTDIATLSMKVIKSTSNVRAKNLSRTIYSSNLGLLVDVVEAPCHQRFAEVYGCRCKGGS
jgi:hypothetical protein